MPSKSQNLLLATAVPPLSATVVVVVQGSSERGSVTSDLSVLRSITETCVASLAKKP